MISDEKQKKQIENIAKKLRSTGWMFLIFGSVMLICSVIILLDPEASISINRVSTSELSAKIEVTILALAFPIIGFVLVTVPKANWERIINAFNRWAKAWWRK